MSKLQSPNSKKHAILWGKSIHYKGIRTLLDNANIEIIGLVDIANSPLKNDINYRQYQLKKILLTFQLNYQQKSPLY